VGNLSKEVEVIPLLKLNRVCYFDEDDDRPLWKKLTDTTLETFKLRTLKKIMQEYNVFVYQMLLYPANELDKDVVGKKIIKD
jgi:hypothetical protein